MIKTLRRSIIQVMEQSDLNILPIQVIIPTKSIQNVNFKQQSIILKQMDSKLIAFLILAGVASVVLFNMRPQVSNNEFAIWKSKHGKTYSSQLEENYRLGVFRANLEKINTHNADSTQTYTMAMNQFGDLTNEEFIQTYLNTKVNTKARRHTVTPINHPIVGDIDWDSQGKVTPVKDQGQCGSCWAFSATASIESAVLIAGRSQVLLSEQQLVDCSQAYGNYGCNGGWMDSAFQYIIDNGIQESSAYPYVARDQTCKISGGNFRISGFIDYNNCNAVWNALQTASISVAVDASNWSFYASGIFSNCGTAVNHGVLLVGGDGSTFWRIKNSWGGNWGEKGFIRLRNGNTCAVCSYASNPVL